MSDWDSGQVMPNNEAAFDKAMEQLRGQALNVAAHLSVDPSVRLSYGRNIDAMSLDLRMRVRVGEITWRQAAEQANVLRNELLQLARGQSTPVGKAMAESMKRKGLTLNAVIAKYTLELFGKEADFPRLKPEQKNAVYAKVVERSGASNPRTNLLMSRLSIAGRALWVLSISLAAYNIAVSEDKVKAIKQEGALASVSIVGGIAGGAIAGLMCGPGAPVCVGVGAFVGGVLAVYGLQTYW
jgi:hypothetical protein